MPPSISFLKNEASPKFDLKFLLIYLPTKGRLQALSYKKGKKDLNNIRIPYICKQNPMKVNLNITIIENPTKYSALPFNFPNYF